MCDTYHSDYLSHTTFHFYLIDFQLKTDFPFEFILLQTIYLYYTIDSYLEPLHHWEPKCSANLTRAEALIPRDIGGQLALWARCLVCKQYKTESVTETIPNFGSHSVKSLEQSSKFGFSRKCFLKEQNPSPFPPCRTSGSNNSFTLIENCFRFLR